MVLHPNKRKAVLLVIVTAVLAVVSVCLLTMDKIDTTEYQVSVDYGDLSAEQIAVMHDILSCSKTGDTVIEHNLSLDELDKVIGYIGLYFGTNLAHMNVALWRPGYAEVKPELVRTLEQDKADLDAIIDCIVSEMYEGSDRFKLWQISNYLATTIHYSYKLADIEPLSGLSGKGSCMTYSMLFYKMARRVGIQAYICRGEADNGKMVAIHAWNMVVLDGERYFYDVTWYDTIIPTPWYLHSKTGWGRDYTLRFD